MSVRSRSSSNLTLYWQLVDMQRRVPYERIRPPSVLNDPEPPLRINLLRAGAAWLIAWASLITLLSAAHK